MARVVEEERVKQLQEETQRRRQRQVGYFLAVQNSSIGDLVTN